MNTFDAIFEAALVLAHLLDRLDTSARPVDAHQYRVVASRLSASLRDFSVDWQPLLERSPAAARLYENLHYEHAGLCCSPLDAAVMSEWVLRDVLAVAGEKLSPGSAKPDARAF